VLILKLAAKGAPRYRARPTTIPHRSCYPHVVAPSAGIEHLRVGFGFHEALVGLQFFRIVDGFSNAGLDEYSLSFLCEYHASILIFDPDSSVTSLLS
jgi:hypothetical protein